MQLIDHIVRNQALIDQSVRLMRALIIAMAQAADHNDVTRFVRCKRLSKLAFDRFSRRTLAYYRYTVHI